MKKQRDRSVVLVERISWVMIVLVLGGLIFVNFFTPSFLKMMGY